MRAGAAKTASHRKSRRPCIILYMQIRSSRILLRTREKSRWRAILYGTWRSPCTNLSASFCTLSSAWQSRERMGEDAYSAYSRCGRINVLSKGKKDLLFLDLTNESQPDLNPEPASKLDRRILRESIKWSNDSLPTPFT